MLVMAYVFIYISSVSFVFGFFAGDGNRGVGSFVAMLLFVLIFSVLTVYWLVRFFRLLFNK